MGVIIERRYSNTIHPLHAILLAGSVPLFLGALLSDWAYASTFGIQWNNFASWLIVGGMVFTTLALIFAIVDCCWPRRRLPGLGVYTLLLLVVWIVGLFNGFMHARDAWASMPTGLVLSIVVFVFACAATWFGFRTPRLGGVA